MNVKQQNVLKDNVTIKIVSKFGIKSTLRLPQTTSVLTYVCMPGQCRTATFKKHALQEKNFKRIYMQHMHVHLTT